MPMASKTARSHFRCSTLPTPLRPATSLAGADTKPSCGAVIGFKAASGVIHYVIADFLRDRDPEAAKVFQVITIVIQGGAVAANMRFVF